MILDSGLLFWGHPVYATRKMRKNLETQ